MNWPPLSIWGSAQKMIRFGTALPHENLPFSSSSRYVPITLLWSFLQDHNYAHLIGGRRRTWYSLERKRKIFHEASQHLTVASARLMQIPRGEKSGTIIAFSSQEGSAPADGITV